MQEFVYNETRTKEDENVFLTTLHRHYRVVEERLGDFGVELRADVDEDGERLESRETQHRDEKPRLVAADPVAVVEGDVHVMRRVTGRGVLHGKAHVADLLGDELEDAFECLSW